MGKSPVNYGCLFFSSKLCLITRGYPEIIIWECVTWNHNVPQPVHPKMAVNLSMRIHKYGISAYVYACVIFFNVFDLFIYLFFLLSVI